MPQFMVCLSRKELIHETFAHRLARSHRGGGAAAQAERNGATRARVIGAPADGLAFAANSNERRPSSYKWHYGWPRHLAPPIFARRSGCDRHRQHKGESAAVRFYPMITA
jgi:hypothetical protein